MRCEWGQPTRPRRRTSSLSTGRANVPGRLLPIAQGCSALAVESEVEDRTVSSSVDDQRSLVLTRRASILQPTLSTSCISFSNSAELSILELECFQYIPSSYLVLGLGKPWKRSIISYLHSSIAKQEPGVVRGFTAVAAMELRSREIVPSTQTDVKSLSSLDRAHHLQSIAMSNYRHALQELSSILNRATRPDRSEEDLNALFGLWFLMINFEQYGSELVDNSHIHLNGIRSFLSRALRSEEILKLPPASQMMLYFIWSVLSTSSIPSFLPC